MSRKINGKQLGSLIEARNKLILEYDAQTRVRRKMESDLDRLTCRIAKMSGLEPRSFGPGGMFDPLKGVRE